MRVLCTIPRYVPVPSGGERAAHGWLAELVRHDCDVTVLTATRHPRNLPEAVVDGVRVLYDRADYDLGDYVAQLRPDFVLTQFEAARATVNWCATHTPRGAALPVGVLCHGPYGYTELAEAGVADDVDLWIFNSCYLRDLAPPLPSVVVSPPIDRARVTVQDFVFPGARYAATLINLFENKGPHVLRGLAQRFPERRFLGVLGGYGEQQRCDDLRNVTHWAPRPDVGVVYAHSNVLLLPSREESFGMVGVEAQLNGVPVIAADIPSLREALGAGATYCDRDDLDAWAQALLRFDDTAHRRAQAELGLQNVARYALTADVVWLLEAMRGTARRRPWSAGRADRQRRRVAERALRVREIFIRAGGREPTPEELAVHAGGPEPIAALEFIVPRLLRG